VTYNVKSICGMIDSTLLDHYAPPARLRELCDFAVENEVCAVCVYPEHMHAVFEYIGDSGVRLDAVAGFPHGTESTKDKCTQAEQRIRAGADEIDMVMNLKMFFDKQFSRVADDIRAVVETAKGTQMQRDIIDIPVVKVIIESAVLEDEEKRLGRPEGVFIKDAAMIVADAGADYVKTSTGMHKSGGVRDGHVALIRSVIPGSVRVKAAGGIRTWEHVGRLLKEGAERFGTSSAKTIIDGFRENAEERSPDGE